MPTSDASPDPHDLQRFVEAQHGTYPRALAELRAGRKRSHWIWYIFPQIAGLGLSHMSVRYAISSLEEARAYLAHDVLGRRLRECAAALNALPTNDAASVLGHMDAVKLRSSLTLFAEAAPSEAVFREALDKFFEGRADEATITRLRGAART